LAGHVVWLVTGFRLAGVEANDAAGERRAYAGRLAGEGAGAVLAADSGSQDGERDDEYDDRDES
jgi:hypothetical protein